MAERIEIFDTTLRDGEQSPGASMNTHEKVQMALQLERLGVDVIEAGFPVASPQEFESVQNVAAAGDMAVFFHYRIEMPAYPVATSATNSIIFRL